MPIERERLLGVAIAPNANASAARSSTRPPAVGCPTASARAGATATSWRTSPAQEIAAAQLHERRRRRRVRRVPRGQRRRALGERLQRVGRQGPHRRPRPRCCGDWGKAADGFLQSPRVCPTTTGSTHEGRLGRGRDRRPLPDPVADRSSGGSTARTSAKGRGSRRTRSTGRCTWPTTWRSGCCRGRSRRPGSPSRARPPGRPRGRRWRAGTGASAGASPARGQEADAFVQGRGPRSRSWRAPRAGERIPGRRQPGRRRRRRRSRSRPRAPPRVRRVGSRSAGDDEALDRPRAAPRSDTCTRSHPSACRTSNTRPRSRSG